MRDIDISDWVLKKEDQTFRFGVNTILAHGLTSIFPSQHTQIFVEENNKVSLLYPNRTEVVSYVRAAPEEVVVVETITEAPQKEVVPEKIIIPVSVPEQVPEKIEVVQEEKEESFADDLVASPSVIDLRPEQKEEKSMYPYLIGLISLISIGSLLLLSRLGREDTAEDKGKEVVRARDFTIVE